MLLLEADLMMRPIYFLGFMFSELVLNCSDGFVTGLFECCTLPFSKQFNVRKKELYFAKFIRLYIRFFKFQGNVAGFNFMVEMLKLIDFVEDEFLELFICLKMN
jgi:hypothetical protein